MPNRYIVKRRWQDIVHFHETLVKDLVFDSSIGLRRVKNNRDPALPKQANLEAWVNEYAIMGDACALGRGELFNELGDLHWVYTEKSLGPYFDEVNKLLEELPTELLLGCAVFRRFVTVGILGPRGDAAAAAPKRKAQPAQRFFGQGPTMPSEADIARAAQLQLRRRTASEPALVASGKTAPVAAAKLLVGGKR